MNILILSCGTRNKVVQYFKAAFAGVGNVVATDMSPYAPAIYDADKFYIVPRMTDPGYLEVILDICQKEQIAGVLSLIDPELELLAVNRERFAEIGTQVIGSDVAQCHLAFDKMEMFRWLTEHGYRCARSYSDEQVFLANVAEGKLSYPVFVKPICGSASLSVNKAVDEEVTHFLMNHGQNMMIQEFLSGQEIGADVYIDLISGEVVSIFTKKKLLMRAGETDKAVSFKDEKLFALIEKFAKESGFRGQIDIDIFEIDGEYYISEVNPRFGGGYPHAYECGADHMTLILNNLQGKANASCIGQYRENLVMMKYNELRIMDVAERVNKSC
jgi:carbamoyl-phosphate synthase large subunit